MRTKMTSIDATRRGCCLSGHTILPAYWFFAYALQAIIDVERSPAPTGARQNKLAFVSKWEKES
jgi:hypothetical protein